MPNKLILQPGRCFRTKRLLVPIFCRRFLLIGCLLIMTLSTSAMSVSGGDLDDVRKAGKLRHLGIPYANFVSNQGDGLDVELMKLFASYLGVEYEFVQSSWSTIIPDLTGKTIRPEGDMTVTGSCPIRGDVIASGFTILPWRKKIVDFSTHTFPTGVWLIARADSKISPVVPSGSIEKDIDEVKMILGGKSVLAIKHSCLDPELYQLEKQTQQFNCLPLTAI